MSASLWASLLEGRQVGDYVLESHIGDGGFGIVYRGRHTTTDAVVAVKVLDPGQASDPQFSSEFQNEGVLLRKLHKRSHVINWIDSGTQVVHVSLNGASAPISVSFHVLALASGGLAEITSVPANLAAIAWDERIAHWRGAILGVHQMHLSTVAHRDLKAENCLLMAGTKNSIEVRVADLGRSKDFSLAPTMPAIAYLAGLGDLSHAAPEFLYLQGGESGDDFRLADLYGLGSLLTELATGHSMTSLAIGSWNAVFQQAQLDLRAGVTRNLATLQSPYRRACAEAVQDIPPVIRGDVAAVLAQLCNPVPRQRLPRYGGRRKRRDDGLQWLLAKADILSRRLKVENKNRSFKRKQSTV
jgi:serine/threonine protein kinase